MYHFSTVLLNNSMSAGVGYFSIVRSAKYRPEIDGLRALAILPVVFYHAQVGAFSGGYVGVDIF